MSVLRRRASPLRPVPPDRLAGVLRLCAAEPVASVCLAHQLERWPRWGRGDVVALGSVARPTAAAWTTASAMPYGLAGRPQLGMRQADPAEVRALAEHCLGRLTRRGSLAGPVQDIALLWEPLEDLGLRVRQERWNQPVLCAPWGPGGEELAAEERRRRPELAWISQSLRAATVDEEELVLPASVAMFTEELGYDPTTSGPSYARHVRWLLAAGRGYVVFDDGAGEPARLGSPRVVAFKADVGALWHPGGSGVAQLTGVWTRPDLRGRGVATSALAAVVDAVRRDHVGPHGEVSLYVNDFNTAGMALYRRLGFTRRGTYATILL